MGALNPLLSGLVLAAAALLPSTSSATLLLVTINTTPLAGQSGSMAFDLYQGSSGALNSAVLSSFSSSSQLGSSSTAGNVVGSLSSNVTFRASTFFNELLQSVVFQAGVTSFQLDVSNVNTAGSIPDSFSMFLLNSSLIPFVTTDPSGASALFSIDLLQPLAPAVYTSAFATASVSVVPEPAAYLTLGGGLLVVMGCMRRRLSASAERRG